MAQTPDKKRRGRPPKSSGTLKVEYLDVRIDASEKEAFWDAANLAGVPLSVWVRERLRAAARRELIEGGKPIAFLKQPKG